MVVDARPGAPKLSRTSSGGCRFCAIVVTQFVTHSDATSAPIRVSGKRWSSDPRSGLLGAWVDRFRVRAESALSTGRNLRAAMFGTYWPGRGPTVQQHGPRSFRSFNSPACAEFCGQCQKAHGPRPGAADELGLSGSPRISGALDPLTPCGATASPFDAQGSGA
jgi:hypothetical protein